MSLITFRDKNTSGDPVGPTWYLNFDALTVEELTRTAEVTQYPVETGATLSDHYQPMPREITLRGVVTETPSGTWTNLEGMQNAAAPPTMVARPLQTSPKPDVTRVGPAGILRPVSTSILPGRRVVQSNIERATMYIPRFAATTLQVAGTGIDPATGTGDINTRSGVARLPRFVEMIEGLMDGRFTVNVILQTGAEYANMMITDFRAPRVAGSSGSMAITIDLQEVVQAYAATKSAPLRSSNKHKPRKAKGHTGPSPTVKSGVEASRAINIDAIAASGFTL